MPLSTASLRQFCSYIATYCFLLLTSCNSTVPKQTTPPDSTQTATKPASNNGLNEHWIYTKHAKCRMQCRHINESEIHDVVDAGQINYRKSDENAQPCPTYSYEGFSHDHQRLRIVIGKCPDVTKVITCIDLDNEFQCDCH